MSAPSTPDPELPRAVALAWGVAASPQRGPKREMSVERIVDAAVEIADADGLGAVSMAAVAAKLGYTAMSLYRYVSAKDDLVLLMQETGIGLPPSSWPDTAAGPESESESAPTAWRARTEALYRAQVALYLEHPWLLDIPITGSPTTPHSAAWMDAGLAAFEGSALSHAERLGAVLTVTGYARWCGAVFTGYARSAASGGLSDADITVREDELFRTLIDADAFPALRAAIDADVFLSESDPFGFGLARLLDGVEAFAGRRSAGAPPEHHPAPEDPRALDGDKRVREARKAVREAERALRDAQRALRQVTREAHERVQRAAGHSSPRE